MQHVFVDRAYLFFFSITPQLKRLHHKSPIKLFTFKKEKVLYLNQLEMKFLELLRAKYFDKKNSSIKMERPCSPHSSPPEEHEQPC